MAVAKRRLVVTGSPLRGDDSNENQALETEHWCQLRTGAQKIRSRCTLGVNLSILACGSPLATLKSERGPFDVRQIESKIPPGRRRHPRRRPPASAKTSRRRGRLPRIRPRSAGSVNPRPGVRSPRQQSPGFRAGIARPRKSKPQDRAALETAASSPSILLHRRLKAMRTGSSCGLRRGRQGRRLWLGSR